MMNTYHMKSSRIRQQFWLRRLTALFLAVLLSVLPVRTFLAEERADETIITEYYKIPLSEEFASRYIWKETSFEGTYSLYFYDRASYSEQNSYQSRRFSLQLCKYSGDVYLYPDDYVLGDLWILDQCCAFKISCAYEKGTAEYQSVWDDAVWAVSRLQWKDGRELTYRTSLTWPDTYRQFIIGRYFLTTDAYQGKIVYKSDTDYRIALHDMDHDYMPELIIGNGAGDEEERCAYIYTCDSGNLRYLGVGPAEAYLSEDWSCPGLFGRFRRGEDFEAWSYYGKNGQSLKGDFLRSVVTDDQGGRKVTSGPDQPVLMEALDGELEKLKTWSCDDIRREGWSAFLKDYDYGLYADEALDFSKDILPPALDWAPLDALSRHILESAQKLYDDEMDGYKTVDSYIASVVDRRLYYENTLAQSAYYRKAYDTYINYAEAGLSACLSYALGGGGKRAIEMFREEKVAMDVISPLLDMYADEGLNLVLDELHKELPDMSAGEFVYCQGKAGAKQVKTGELYDVMQKVHTTGHGKFLSVDDAIRFIWMIQENKSGFASLSMARDYYMDQLNRPIWEIMAEMTADVLLSTFIGKLVPDGWAQGYVTGKELDALEDCLDNLGA